MAFASPLDIANRACQYLNVPRMSLFTEHTLQAQEINFNYDKLRLAEIRRNMWIFSTRRVVLRSIALDTVLWTAPTWVSGTNYSAGAIVSFTPADGIYTGKATLWQLSVGESPSSTRPDQDANWEHFAGPQAIDLYNTGLTGGGNTAQGVGGQLYQSGEIVLTPAAWSSATTYSINNVVSRVQADGSFKWYVSLTNSNLNNDPLTSTTNWVLWTSTGRSSNSYGSTATKSPIPLTYPTGWNVFLSLYNNNADNPLTNTVNWINLSAASISPLITVWPQGAGPSYDPSTMNAFYIPYSYLKRAPTDPKGGQLGYLGANSGAQPEDYVLEGNYIVSRAPGPIVFRFVADITSVPAMDPMFCEGVAARLAWMSAPRVKPGDVGILRNAQAAYTQFVREARLSNAIEVSAVFEYENRYVTVRA